MKPQYAEGSQYEFLGVQVKGRVLQATNEPNIKWRDILISLMYGPESDCEAEPNSPGQKSSLITAPFAGAPVSVPGLPAPIILGGVQQTFVAPLLTCLNAGWVNNGVASRWIDTPTDPWQNQGIVGSPGASPSGQGTGLTINTIAVGPQGQVLTGGANTPTIGAGGTGYSVGDTVLLQQAPVIGGTPAVFRVTAVAAGVVTGIALISGGTGYVAQALALTGGNDATITITALSSTGGLVTVTAAPVVAGTGYVVGDVLAIDGPGVGGLVKVTAASALTGTGGGAIATVVLLLPGVGYGPLPLVGQGTTMDNSWSYTNPQGDGYVGGSGLLGSIATRLPLDNNVTLRRTTLVRGKSWRGNIRPTPIDESHSTDDQLNAVGQAAWSVMKQAMYSPISDGETVLYPLLVSVTESQMVRNPTMIGYATLMLPGVDPASGVLNPVIDLALGESRRRKERKTTVV